MPGKRYSERQINRAVIVLNSMQRADSLSTVDLLEEWNGFYQHCEEHGEGYWHCVASAINSILENSRIEGGASFFVSAEGKRYIQFSVMKGENDANINKFLAEDFSIGMFNQHSH